MPFRGILTRLAAKTAGRTIRADNSWISKANGKPPFAAPSGSILAVAQRRQALGELDIA